MDRFPDRASILQLVGEVLAKWDDEWAEGGRYIGLDRLAKSLAVTRPKTQAINNLACKPRPPDNGNE